MWRFGRAFLENYRDGARLKDDRSKNQFNFMFAPMLTFHLGSQGYAYQELEPFCPGTPNAVHRAQPDSMAMSK